MAQVTIANLTAALPAGITLDTDYAAGDEGLDAVVDMLEAFRDAQATVNDGAPAGQRVASVTAGTGAPIDIENPPGSGTIITVVPRVFTVTVFQQQTISGNYAPLA